jgi:hypothetical protein
MLVLVLATAAAPAYAATATPSDTSGVRTTGRRVQQLVAAHDTAKLWGEFDTRLRLAMGDSAIFVRQFNDLVTKFGTLEKRLTETVDCLGGITSYRAGCTFSGWGDPLVLQVGIDASGTVSGFMIQPQAPAHDSAHLTIRRRPGFDFRSWASG